MYRYCTRRIPTVPYQRVLTPQAKPTLNCGSEPATQSLSAWSPAGEWPYVASSRRPRSQRLCSWLCRRRCHHRPQNRRQQANSRSSATLLRRRRHCMSSSLPRSHNSSSTSDGGRRRAARFRPAFHDPILARSGTGRRVLPSTRGRIATRRSLICSRSCHHHQSEFSAYRHRAELYLP